MILGGYCRIIGMTNLEEVAPEDEERVYRSKGYVQRVFVAFAGPAVHFLIAFVLMFAILFVAGDLRHERGDQARRGATRSEGSRAPCRRHASLSIDETPITKWEQVSGVIVKHKAGDDGSRSSSAATANASRKNVELTEQVVEGQRAVLAGISASVVVPHPGFFKSIAMAPAGVVSIADDAVDVLGQIFSPSGISKYMRVLTGADKSEAANQQRFLSPVGFAQVASHVVAAGWVAVAGLLLVINVFLGLVNLVPLLPFDGGHIAIATYEQIAVHADPRRVRVDAAKLMPIAGAVLVVLMFILVSSLFLDITHPVSNPF